MDIPPGCPHGNDQLETDGLYYRQVHPTNFQDGRALPPAFILQDTSCHLTLSLNDAARTTPERCHQEYTSQGRRLSAAVLELTTQELGGSFPVSTNLTGNGTRVDHSRTGTLRNKLHS